MDGNAEFRAFFKAVVASPLPQLGGTSTPSVAGSNPAMRRVLERLIRAESTRSLNPGDLATLRDPSQSSTIRDQIERVLAARRHLDRRLLALVPRRDAILVHCLLVLLQHTRIKQLLQVQDALVEGYRRAITLHTIILLHRLGRTEKQAHQQLQRDVRDIRNDLAVQLNTLIESARGFTITHQFFCHSEIDAMAALEGEWRARAIDGIRVADKPTPQEVADHGRLLLLDVKLANVVQERAALRQSLTDLQLRRRTTRGDTAVLQLRADIAEASSKLRGFNRGAARMRRERQGLERRVRPRTAAIRRFLAAAEEGRFDATVISERDAFLREHDALASEITDRSLFGATESDTWRNYQLLLAQLADGDSALSLQFLTSAWLGRYGDLNLNRDIGLRVTYGGGTYTRHGLGAIDLMAEAGAEVRCVVARRVTLPRRVLQANGLGDAPRPFQYRGSVIGQTDVRASSDREDIFFKIAFGVLRRQGQRLSATDVSAIMNTAGFTNPPEYLSDSQQRRFDPARVLAGLAYFNLTEEPDAEDVNGIRDDLLDDVAQFVRRDLHLSEDAPIFRETDRSADAGRVGVLRLIAHRDRGAVLNSVKRMMESQVAEPNGIVHRLWQLLWGLVGPSRSVADLLQHASGGQSLVVDHRYRSLEIGAPEESDLVIRVLYSHLHANRLAGSRLGDTVRPGTVVGEVGLTGNAAGAHLHLQITLHRGNDTLGGLLPHEYFELN